MQAKKAEQALAHCLAQVRTQDPQGHGAASAMPTAATQVQLI